MNWREQLEAFETKHGDRIEAVVVEGNSRGLLSREEGLAELDREFIHGYSGSRCSTFYAWTASRVFFTHDQNGAVTLHYIPRQPAEIEPEHGGNEHPLIFVPDPGPPPRAYR